MRAVLIQEPGGPEALRPGEVPDPAPSPGEILVRVRATALNRADLLQRRGLYPPPPGVHPRIPGLEFAGSVEAAGPAVTEFQPGQRVMGLLPGAGYAEKVVTPERLALPIPDRLSFQEAAGIPEVFLTAFDALHLQGGLGPGHTLLLHGAGSGVGTAALQLCRLSRATSIGTSRSRPKLDRCRELGLDHALLTERGEFREAVLELTGGRGVDLVLDMVGAPYLEQNLSCLAPRGRLILIGLLGGPSAPIDLSRILKQSLRIRGTVLRPRPVEEKIRLNQEFRRRILPFFENGVLTPIIDREFPLEEAAEAHSFMESNGNFGKIVLIC
ncbi:MAG: NAD(P)H-quinone oxidoreductase [Candidatus Aminicenantes bacterium]|nr:NAD(P)H-quinone oxidoreductase [Candidatus Aminicenantes bacterium]